MQRKSELYRGKTKTLYLTDNPKVLVLEFRDDASALDGNRVEKFEDKGMINNKFNLFIMKKLLKEGVPTQIERMLSDTESLVKRLRMIPIEFVIRNQAAGSLVKRLGISEGTLLKPAILDLFLKNDIQHDPIINESYCETFGWATKKHLREIKQLSCKINKILNPLFDDAGLILVDFKLEFGLFDGEVVLGDEFSPDTSRFWDKKTKSKLDKDCFRQSLGELINAYREVSNRLGIF